MPSCLEAVQALDRTPFTEKNHRWGQTPAITKAQVVSLVEEDILLPLLTDLERRVDTGTVTGSMIRSFLTQNEVVTDGDQALLTDMVKEGAYRSALILTRACAKSGRKCANFKLKELGNISGRHRLIGLRYRFQYLALGS